MKNFQGKMWSISEQHLQMPVVQLALIQAVQIYTVRYSNICSNFREQGTSPNDECDQFTLYYQMANK